MGRPPPPPQCLKRGTISNFLKMTFLIWFHILDLKDICFLIKQLFGGKIQDFTAIFKKNGHKKSKKWSFFFSNVQKNWFGLSKCILCSLGQRNTSKLMKNNWKIDSKVQKKWSMALIFGQICTKTGKIWVKWAGSRLLTGFDEFYCPK